MYSKTSQNQLAIGPILNNGRFRELEYHYNGFVWVISWDPNEVIDIGEWLICGGGRLERYYIGA